MFKLLTTLTGLKLSNVDTNETRNGEDDDDDDGERKVTNTELLSLFSFSYETINILVLISDLSLFVREGFSIFHYHFECRIISGLLYHLYLCC